MEDSTRPTINSLPDEMLLEIFSFLKIQTIHKNVGAVCARWKELTLVPTVNRSISIRTFDDMDFLQSLPTAEHIWRVKFKAFLNVMEFNRWLEYLASLCPDLTHLKVASHILFGRKGLAIISTCFPNLKKLNIHIKDRYGEEFVRAVRNIHSIAMHDPIPRGVMFSMANLCHNITELHLDDYPWKGYCVEMKYFLRFKGEHLTKLILGFADDDMFELIASCEKLTDLRISNCMEVHRDGLMKLVSLTQLDSLHLVGLIKISEDHLNCFFEECHMPKLINLNLCASSFSDLTAEILSSKIPRLKKLQLIDCDNLTPTGVLLISLQMKLIMLYLNIKLPSMILDIICNSSTLSRIMLQCSDVQLIYYRKYYNKMDFLQSRRHMMLPNQ